MKKIILLFLALGMFQANADGATQDACTVTVPSQCQDEDILDSIFSVRKDAHHVSFIVELTCQVYEVIGHLEGMQTINIEPNGEYSLSESMTMTITRPVGYKTFSAEHQVDSASMKAGDFFSLPTDVNSIYLDFEYSDSDSVASLYCPFLDFSKDKYQIKELF